MPLFWLSLAFLCGILLASWLHASIAAWIIVTALPLLLLLPPVRQQWIRNIPGKVINFSDQLRIPGPHFYPLLVIFVSLGAIRFQASLPVIGPSQLSYYNDHQSELVLEAVLVDPPDNRDSYTNLLLDHIQLRQVDDLTSIPVDGLLLARVFPEAGLQYGDRLRLQGHLLTPPENEDFSYSDYLAGQNIYSYMSYPSLSLLGHGEGNKVLSMLYSIRAKATDVVYQLYPDPEASLLAGILLGDQSGIPRNVQEAFRLTGTSHIIVISGFNITIIVALLTFIFTRLLGTLRGAIASAIGIILYTLMVGADPAVVRAAILGMLALLALQVGRRQVGVNSLVFAAAIMALLSPTVLWDISFQLSFMATLGIVLYADPLTRGFTSLATRLFPPERVEKLAGPVGEYLLITLAAMLTTLPVMVYYFKSISLTSLIANPLILPVQPPLMVLGGLSVLGGLVFQPLGELLSWLTWPFIAYTIRIVEWLAAIPHGSIPVGQISLPWILLFYAALFTLTFARSRLPNLLTRLSPAIPLTAMVILAFLIWKAAFTAPDGRLHVTILDVGAGESVFIQSPQGRSVLINGGPSTVRLSDALGRRMPPFNRTLDWLIVADIDNEDLSGLPLNLHRFPPANILWAGNTYGTRAASDLWSALISSSIPITRMQAGQTLDLGSGAGLKVLSTDTKGAVLLLTWDDFRLLLPMGADFTSLENLQQNNSLRDLPAVLLAESGYAPLNPPELLSFLHPQLAILSVASADRTGLPSPETIDALNGTNLLRTDVNGWIELTTDGRQMWVNVERVDW